MIAGGEGVDGDDRQLWNDLVDIRGTLWLRRRCPGLQ